MSQDIVSTSPYRYMRDMLSAPSTGVYALEIQGQFVNTYSSTQIRSDDDYYFAIGSIKIQIKEIIEMKQQVEELRAEVLKLKTGQIKLHTEEVEL